MNKYGLKKGDIFCHTHSVTLGSIFIVSGDNNRCVCIVTSGWHGVGDDYNISSDAEIKKLSLEEARAMSGGQLPPFVNVLLEPEPIEFECVWA